MTGASEWPLMGWASGTPMTPTGMVHATYPRQDTALCGAHTPHTGQYWPATSDGWVVAHSRCPSCAHRLYTPGPR